MENDMESGVILRFIGIRTNITVLDSLHSYGIGYLSFLSNKIFLAMLLNLAGIQAPQKESSSGSKTFFCFTPGTTFPSVP